MYAIVIGCGKIGYHLTRALLASGNEVVVIERDARRAESATEEFGSIVVASDGTEPTVLGDVGAERCDVLISTTGADATNLVACQVGKWSFDIARVIAVVTDPDHVPLFKTLGVDVAVSTTELILSHMEEELTGGGVVHLLPLHGATATVVSVRVPPGSPAIGRELSALATPPGATLAAVIGKDGQPRTISNGLRLEAGDEVLAITPPEQEGELWRALTGGV